MADRRDPPATPTPESRPSSDQSLLRRFRRGDQDGATQLYLRYAPRVRALVKSKTSPDLARRVDADDLVQSVFRSFFQGVTHGYYDVPAGEELWKLFVVIALNKIRTKGSYFRAAKRDMRRTAGPVAGGDGPDVPDGHETEALGVLRLTVAEALDRLPPQQREVVTLRIEGYSVEEIARQSGRSKRTVERLLQEARRRLAQDLQGD